MKGAWQPSALGWYLMLPKVELKRAGFEVGSRVEVAFKVLSQSDVDVPLELQQVIDSKPSLAKAWNELSPGAQRGLAHWIASVKRHDTRAVRLSHIIEVLSGRAEVPWKRQ
jgi:uncharacterized protein YdeI (YjbR/CyaY-like superfamily)